MASQALQRCAGARTIAAACARRLTPSTAAAAAAAGRRRITVSMATAGPQVPAAWAEAEPGSEMAKFQETQRAAPRPSLAEEARTLMSLGRTAMLATQSVAAAFAGHPYGSIVEFAVDDQGRPILAVSALSPHTADLKADGRCSLTVAAPGFSGLQDARFTLVGTAKVVPDAERAAARETYLTKYPNSYWVDFGDMTFFRVEGLAGGRLTGGFGRAGTVAADAYASARPDPVAAFAAPVCGHMNADHGADLQAMVKHYLGLDVSSVRMLDLDRLGFNAQLTLPDGPIKARVPFPRPAEDRKSVKDVIVEMTRAARG